MRKQYLTTSVYSRVNAVEPAPPGHRRCPLGGES
jgi:hypothetical protein